MHAPLALALLFLSVTCAGDNSQWLEFSKDDSNMNRLRCSVCLRTMEDVAAHLQAIKEMRGAGVSGEMVERSLKNMCEKAEHQFWAMKWTPAGPAELKYLKRYDIHEEEARTTAELANLGADMDIPTFKDPESYFGTQAQQQWAKKLYLSTCNEVLQKMPYTKWAAEGTTPVYPKDCPLDTCKNDPSLHAVFVDVNGRS